jgi:hypothetical protein
VRVGENRWVKGPEVPTKPTRQRNSFHGRVFPYFRWEKVVPVNCETRGWVEDAANWKEVGHGI